MPYPTPTPKPSLLKQLLLVAGLLAILSLFSPPQAQAANLAPAGSAGQVLIFPYYTVNGNFKTSFNLINSTDLTKAVKLRFRESNKSNDVLDFNVYMSPRDVFSVTLEKTLPVFPDITGGVLLTTSDSTCTHPAIPVEGVQFRDIYTATQPEDVLEGYLEVIEMGVVTDPDVIAGTTHTLDRPGDCSSIQRAWQEGRFTQGGAASNTRLIDVVNPDSPAYPNPPSTAGYYGSHHPAGLSEPTGGLIGNSILVDTLNLAAYVAEPSAIQNYSTRAQHYLSSDYNFYMLPSLASGSVQDGWGLVQRDWGLDDINIAPSRRVPTGINPMPITQALLTTSLSNQYFLGQPADTSENTYTDWVISAPMRKHGIYNGYMYISSPTGYLPGQDVPVSAPIGAAEAPFGYWKALSGTSSGTSSGADMSANFTYWGKEEEEVHPQFEEFSPPTGPGTPSLTLQREVNIFTLTRTGGPTSVLGSNSADKLLIVEDLYNGWGTLEFDSYIYDLDSPRYTAYWVTPPDLGENPGSTEGVPVHGFMAARHNRMGETLPMAVTH